MARSQLLSDLIVSRKRKNLTQKEVAERMGVLKQQVSNIERGNPRLDTLERYAKALGVGIKLSR